MRTWLKIQFVGAGLGAISGILIGMSGPTIFLQMLGAVVFGFAALTMAVIGIGAVAEDQSKQEIALLKQIKDALQMQSPTSQSRVTDRPLATLAPLPDDSGRR